MKKLYLLRHAKASGPAGGPDDYDRPLAERGIQDATAIGQRLRSLGEVPEVVYCSSARRAVETLAHAFPTAAQVSVEQSLYGAAPSDVLALVHGLDDAVASALMIGHNPTLEVLALRLADDENTELAAALAENFPTAALAGLTFDVPSWREVAARTGQLELLLTPKTL